MEPEVDKSTDERRDHVLETRIDVEKKSNTEEEPKMLEHCGSEEKQSCVIDVECSDGSGESTACRICHLSGDSPSESSDLIQIGCGCKSDLGIAHRSCVEEWFHRKGNRCCEICGETAKNVKGVDDAKIMDEWSERRRPGEGSNVPISDGSGGFWRGQKFCSFLMACLIISFILSWLFRANLLPY
ncbi:hypothetical protein Sjap_026111 [Stephania japonica]|uniref:RING-CH-type domain-containing protein n=1 Tax=Stephania japonica TaxID=461633 RepID=A0AAP0E5H4_9MAGN